MLEKLVWVGLCNALKLILKKICWNLKKYENSIHQLLKELCFSLLLRIYWKKPHDSEKNCRHFLLTVCQSTFMELNPRNCIAMVVNIIFPNESQFQSLLHRTALLNQLSCQHLWNIMILDIIYLSIKSLEYNTELPFELLHILTFGICLWSLQHKEKASPTFLTFMWSFPWCEN